MNNENSDLSEDIRAIFRQIKQARILGRREESHVLLWTNGEKLRRYLYSFEIVGSDNSFIKSYVDDALARFFNTIDLLAESDGKLLEIGANPYLFTILLKNITSFDLTLTNFFSPNVYENNVQSVRQQIRSSLYSEHFEFEYLTLNVELSQYPFQDGEFDKIIFCEVMEHLVIDPFRVFGKLRRILKRRGELVLTTPNAVRLINVAHMLAGKNFFDRYHPENGIYGRHNREFTLTELISVLEAEDFEIKEAKTLDRYNYDQVKMFVDSYEKTDILPWSGTRVIELLSAIGASIDDRGDNIYIVATKK
jgi:SAM-dependent methyltransferase